MSCYHDLARGTCAKCLDARIRGHEPDDGGYCIRCGLPFESLGPMCASKVRAINAVDHPAHYTSHPSGIECIQIVEFMNFCRGNAIKYIWRAGQKDHRAVEDLKKAVWYLNREIERLEKK